MEGWDPRGTPGQGARPAVLCPVVRCCLLALSIPAAAGSSAGHRGRTGAQPRLGPTPGTNAAGKETRSQCPAERMSRLVKEV